jgi:hypothetical protein
MIRLGLCGAIHLSDSQLVVLSGQKEVEITGIYLPGHSYTSQVHNGDLPVCKDASQLIAGSDALVFTGDPDDDFELIVAALRDSRHILIPNPIFLSRKKVEYLLKLAEEANVALKFRQPIQHHPAIRQVRQFMQKPEYVDIKRRINLSATGSDIKGDMTIALTECIDTSLITNRANLKKHKIVHLPVTAEYPEMIHTRLELDNACIINIQLDRFPGEEIFESTYYQNGIEVRADLLQNRINIIRTDHPCGEGHSYEKVDETDKLVSEILNFIDIIRSDCSPHRPGINGLISFLISNSIWHQLNCNVPA